MGSVATAAALRGATGERSAGDRVLLPALLAFFVLSGLSGLTYEVVWLRYLALVFGVTIYAISTVLTVFMGGLALGGYLAGRVADRLERPLRAYGVIEVGIGLSALLTPLAFHALNALYRAIYPAVPHDLTSLSLVRFVLSCVMLLVPTTLMGATLPIVIRSTLARRTSLGTSLSLLYASNTAGGIVGAYLAGFVLIGTAGVHATTVAAAAINVGVGLAALALDVWLYRQPEGVRATGPAAPAGTDVARGQKNGERGDLPDAGEAAEVVPGADRAGRWLLAALVASGLASLGYQVIWTRVLSVFFEATTYVFSLILCTFLFGLAFGSYAVAPVINRRANWLLVAAVLEWAVGLTAVLSIWAMSQLPRLLEVIRALPLGPLMTSSEQRTTAAMAMLTMFPTTVILGAAFPIVLRLCSGPSPARSATPVVRRLGRAYAANVAGAIVGSWASGFVLIPLLGAQRSLVLLAGLNVAVGLGLLRHALPRRWPAPGIVALAMTGGAMLLTPNLYAAVFSHFGDSIVWFEEGLEQTVTITQGPAQRRMFLNGRHQANDSPGTVTYHALIGHLPLVLLPEPAQGAGAASTRRVLVIGLGGGVTAGAAAAHERTDVEVVELSESVVRGARYFGHVNGDVLDARNVRIVTDDGRNHLLLTREQYDVIMADVIRPKHAGSAVLYSREYFQLARAALSDSGLMIQWVDPELPENHYKMLMRTFLEVFPYATAWVDGSFLIGSTRPYTIDRRVLEARLNGPAAGALRRIGLGTAESVLNLFTATDAELRAFVGEGPVVSDDHPYNEFFRSLPGGRETADLSALKRDPSALLR